MQTLVKSGFLSDLFKAAKGDLTNVDRMDLRRVLGLNPPEYTLQLCSTIIRSTDDAVRLMIARGWAVSPWINQINFPMPDRQISKEIRIKLIKFHGHIDELDGIMKAYEQFIIF